MHELKSFAFCLCVTALLFGIIRAILPDKRYEKYMKLIICAVFALLVIRGISSVSGAGLFELDSVPDVGNADIDAGVRNAVMTYINQTLAGSEYVGCACTDARVIMQNDQYKLSEIYIKNNGYETDKLIGYISEMTGLAEGMIYVTT